jgi:outer membrane protein insertion porin family
MRKIFFLFIAFFLILFINSAQSQTEQTSPSKDQSASLESSTTATVEQEAKLITAIEVKGNKAISSTTIVSKIKTRIGDPYQENVISDDLKRLYLLGYFSDIKIDTENYKNGTKVIISVIERPLIEKITFSGIKRITMKDEKLKEQLKSKEKQYLDYPTLSEDVRTLKKMYEKMGFSDAKVDYRLDLNKETNKANIEFDVLEGKKVRIKNIIVKGNKAFSTGRILKLLKTKRAWLFNAGVLKDEVFEEDLERIKAFYRRQGFTDVRVDYEIKPNTKRPYLLFIYIQIEEGKKYLVGNITIQGNVDIPRVDILAKLKECVPGKVFSQEALKYDSASIQGLYFDKGYISCQVQETTSLNSYTGRVDITYNVIENEIAYVDKIKIRGNVKTRDVVIRRELRIRPGDRFNGDKLRRSKERLQNLGFFEEVNYDTENTQVSNKKDLIVDVKETKTGAFSFGGGYSTVDQFVGFIEIEQKNFDWKNFPYFTGAGQDLKLRASFGTISSGFDLSFTNPWVFDYPVSFGFDAYKHTHKREEDVGYGYDEDVTGADLRLGKELSEYLRGDIMYRFDSIEIDNVTDTSTDDLKSEIGKNNISSITPSLTFDSRDNVFDPRKGDLLTGSFEIAGGPFAGDKDFWKFFGLVSHYFPLPKNSALEIRARVGASESYSNSERLPIYERFFAGGANTIRGYEERGIGPIDSVSKDPLGGESMVIGNIEYSYPLLSFLKAAVFYDTGNVWAKLGDIGKSGFKSGTGLGVRIKTPIGPIRLDYGIPLNKAPGEDSKGSGRLHFSASHGF